MSNTSRRQMKSLKEEISMKFTKIIRRILSNKLKKKAKKPPLDKLGLKSQSEWTSTKSQYLKTKSIKTKSQITRASKQSVPVAMETTKTARTHSVNLWVGAQLVQYEHQVND